MTIEEFNKLRENFRFNTEFGSITEFRFFPSIALLTSPWQPLPTVTARAESAHVAVPDGADPEFVGHEPKGEVRLTHEDIAVLPGYAEFWDALNTLLHARLSAQAAPVPPPEPPPTQPEDAIL